jgi:hypothetical protein
MTDTLAASTLDEFRLWRVDQLRTFLLKRGLKVSGRRKDELVALAFGAVEMGVPIKSSAEEEERARAAQYHSLLNTRDGQLPDPFVDLTDGWLNESVGMTQWPPIMQFDIGDYLLDHTKDRDIAKRMISDYKEGKAFSYFDSKWLRDVAYHNISDSSKYCFLRSSSIPSQNISAVPHKVWVVAVKKTGHVQSAYCTCFAG